MSSTSASNAAAATGEQSDLTAAETAVLDELRAHEKVERVVPYDTDSLHGAMVILDWVTDATMENGTRIIHEKNYTGEIRDVASFIDDLDGVRKTRGSKTGLAEYTFHVTFS